MKKYLLSLMAIGATISTTNGWAEEKLKLAKGTYRVEGKCERAFYLGASTAPKCASYMGITVKNPDTPMFVFPLQEGAWFFVSSGPVDSNGKFSTAYGVSKIFDESLGAEFSYPAGECEITQGQTVHCTVWKDKERTVIARELSFSSSGTWIFSREQ